MPTTGDIHCPICKRDIPEPDTETSQGIAYCHGCNHYFPSNVSATRRRKEVIIPNGTSFLRLRLKEDSLEIKFRWYGNYSLTQIVSEFIFQDFKAPVSALAYLMNKTKVVANMDHLKIVHYPLPLLPKIQIKSEEIKQLFVRPDPNKLLLSEALSAALHSGENKMLLWNLENRVLLFLEQEIERVLGIEDSPVRFEVTE